MNIWLNAWRRKKKEKRKKVTPRALDSRAKKRVLELLQAKIIDYGEVPDLQASKIIEKYKDLSKGLEKKK